VFLIQLIVDFRLMHYFLAFSLKSCKSKIDRYKTLDLLSCRSISVREAHKLSVFWNRVHIKERILPCGREINSRLRTFIFYFISGLDRPLGFQEIEACAISRQSAHDGDKVVGCTHRPPPLEICLVLISVT